MYIHIHTQAHIPLSLALYIIYIYIYIYIYLHRHTHIYNIQEIWCLPSKMLVQHFQGVQVQQGKIESCIKKDTLEVTKRSDRVES